MNHQRGGWGEIGERKIAMLISRGSRLPNVGGSDNCLPRKESGGLSAESTQTVQSRASSRASYLDILHLPRLHTDQDRVHQRVSKWSVPARNQLAYAPGADSSRVY